MSTLTPLSSRGRTWFQALADKARSVDTGLGSVLVADATWGGEQVRLLAIVPDQRNRFPRARHGELGLEEGWALAHHVREAVAADHSGGRRPIIAVVDVQSQAYGRLEALLGIHLSLAAAADAYATARMAGHPVVALIVGTALSGGLLAHGDQAHRLLALDDPQVIIQAMRKQSAARVTRRTVEELDELGKTVIPMAYDVRQFAKLGLLHELITEIDANAPSAAQIARGQGASGRGRRRHPQEPRRSDQPAEQSPGEGPSHRIDRGAEEVGGAMERLTADRPTPTHDLIRLREPSALTADAPAPSWVAPVLRRTPWVVVRRGPVRDGMVPVGVRGLTRAQRFAAFVAVAEIGERLSPEDLTDSRYVIKQDRRDAVPALAALDASRPSWRGAAAAGGPAAVSASRSRPAYRRQHRPAISI